MRERSDEDLMTAYAGGDVQAFEELYRRHRGPLYRFILRQVADPATANDLYQGCWEKVIRARQRYRATAAFPAWFYRIARNHLLDHFRAQRPLAHIEADELQSSTPGPEQVLADEQSAADLAAAISTLSSEQREVLLLRMEAGLDLAAIADVTGVNPETAKSRLRYAVARLNQILAQAGKGTVR